MLSVPALWPPPKGSLWDVVPVFDQSNQVNQVLNCAAEYGGLLVYRKRGAGFKEGVGTGAYRRARIEEGGHHLINAFSRTFGYCCGEKRITERR